MPRAVTSVVCAAAATACSVPACRAMYASKAANDSNTTIPAPVNRATRPVVDNGSPEPRARRNHISRSLGEQSSNTDSLIGLALTSNGRPNQVATNIMDVPLPLTLRVAAPAARPHVPALAGSAVLALLRAGVLLAEPWPLALAVDHAINHRPLAWLGGLPPMVLIVLAGVAVIVLNATVGLLDVAGTLCGERAAERIGASLRQAMFDRTMSLSLRWHDRMRSGELVSRLTTDVGRLLDGIVAVTTTVLPDTVMVVTVLAVLAAVDPELALVGLAVVPVLALMAVRQRRQVRDAQRDARSESGRLAAISSDLIRNVRAVQAFGRTRRAGSIFGARNRELLRVDLRTVGVEARWSPMADLVLACGSGLVLVVGGAHVLGGTLTTGGLLVVLAYLQDLYSPVRGLAKL